MSTVGGKFINIKKEKANNEIVNIVSLFKFKNKTMTLRQEIIRALKTLNPGFLSQIYNLTESLKRIDKERKGKFNDKTHPLAKFVGSIDDAEAQALRTIINKEFSKIDGEW